MTQSSMRVAAVEATLVRSGVARVVDLSDPAETARWAAHDLAIVVEGSLHEHPPLEALTGALAEPYLDRLGGSYLAPDFAADDWLLRYLWLLVDGSVVGTFALPRTLAPESKALYIYSIHVRPELRGGGIATRFYVAIDEAARAQGFGSTRVRTHWSWQPALRFYLARGLWVRAWDGEVELAREGAPCIVETPGASTLELFEDGVRVASARRDGRRLVSFEGDDARARRTLAVHMATRGWPMVRSPGAWSDRGHDVSGPEACASALDAMAQIARARGWVVRAPDVLHAER